MRAIKNIVFLLIILCIGRPVLSQQVTTSPAVFTAEDEVTFTIDVTGTDLEGYTAEVWIWTWVANLPEPEGDAPTNVNPATDDQSAALVTRNSENPNVYTFTMVPTAFLGKDPADFIELGIILKGRDWGDGQTSNILLPVQPLIFVPTENRNFPVKFTQDDIVTLNYDQSLASNAAVASQDELYVYLFYTVRRVDGTVDTDIPYTAWDNVGSSEELKATDQGNGWFSLSILPTDLFELEAGEQLIRIGYIFRNAAGDVEGSIGEAFVTILN